MTDTPAHKSQDVDNTLARSTHRHTQILEPCATNPPTTAGTNNNACVEGMHIHTSTKDGLVEVGQDVDSAPSEVTHVAARTR
jgi:hypothetical protein